MRISKEDVNDLRTRVGRSRFKLDRGLDYIEGRSYNGRKRRRAKKNIIKG